MLLDWPVPLKAIEIAARALPSRDRARFVAFVKTMRSEDLARALPPTVLDAIVVALSPLQPCPAQGSEPTSVASCQRSKVPPDSILAVRPAAEAAGTRRATLTTAWNDGLVARLQRGHGPRLVPAFFLHEAMAIGDAMRERLSASAVAHRLGLPLYAVEQMLCLGVLTASGLRLSTDWDRHFLIETDVPDFTDRIEAAVTRNLSDPIRLVDAFRSIPGRKPWGPAIEAMLADVPFVIADDDGPMFQRVSIERADMLRICRSRFDHAAWPDRLSSEMILEDALEILNLTWKPTAVVFSKPVTGKMPKRIAVDDVLDLAALYVSTGELMCRTSRSSSAIVKFLEDAALTQPFTGCWFRMQAEQALGFAGAMFSCV